MTAEQVFAEPLVARVTGIRRPALKKARLANLQKGTDWWLADSVVTYGAEGLKKLLVSLGLNAGDLTWPEGVVGPEGGGTPERAAFAPPDPTAEASVEPGPAEIVAQATAAVPTRALRELVVRKVAWNPTIVLASPGDAQEEVRVRVRDNKNFRPGMVLRAREPEDAGGLWFMEGNCPRFPGRY